MNSIRTRPKFRKSKFFLFFGLAWLLIGIPFILFGINEYRTNRRFESDAVKTIGKVVSKRQEQRWDSKEKRNETYYYVRYTFKTVDQREIEEEQGVDSDTWERIKDQAPIEIEYLSDDTTYHRIAGTASDFGSYLTFIFGGVMCLIGSIFTIIDIKKRLYTTRILRNGIEVIGTISNMQGSSLTINNVVQINLSYSFKDRMGRDYSGISNYMNPKLLKDVQIGSQCKIAYDKDDPSKNILLSV